MTSYPAQVYLTPSKDGAITLLAIEGDVVAFMTDDGTDGRFNFTTGAFQ
jgi:hypothetical protein